MFAGCKSLLVEEWALFTTPHFHLAPRKGKPNHEIRAGAAVFRTQGAFKLLGELRESDVFGASAEKVKVTLKPALAVKMASQAQNFALGCPRIDSQQGGLP